MKKALLRILALALVVAPVCSCSVFAADDVSRARFGSLRRDDMVVVDVRRGVGTNDVIAVVESYDRSVIQPREAAIRFPVTSVNRKTGDVVLAVGDISGAVDTGVVQAAIKAYDNDVVVPREGKIASGGYAFPVTSVNSKTGAVVLAVGDISGAACASRTVVVTNYVGGSTPGDGNAEEGVDYSVVTNVYHVVYGDDIARLKAESESYADGAVRELYGDTVYPSLTNLASAATRNHRFLHTLASNNYTSAYMANERAWKLEAWQYTNSVTRTDFEAGFTDWAVTPIWAVGRLTVAQISDGDDANAGKWSLFRPQTNEHSSLTALVTPVAASNDATEIQWHNSALTYVDHGTNRTVVIDVAARRTRLSPDFSAGNAELVATIQAKAPAPSDYETVRSNAALGATALQPADISGKADKSDTYTKAQVDSAIGGAIDNLVDGAPDTFNTLKEVADWINDDHSGAAAMDSRIASLESGKADSVTVSNIVEDMISSLQLAEWYPDGSVTNVSQFTKDLNYTFDISNKTAAVKPFNISNSPGTNDNSHIVGECVIPPFVETNGVKYTVSSIAVVVNGTLNPNTNLTSVIIPTTVKEVGVCAFMECNGLKFVSLSPETHISEYGFYGCVAIETIPISSATIVHDGTYAHCVSLHGVNMPYAKSIGQYAFYDCASLTTVNLPHAEDIGEAAFEICDSLKSVFLPAVTNVGSRAFHECPSLESVYLPSAITISGAFMDCASLKTASLPSATSISSTFNRCTSLESVYLPSLTNMSIDTFSRCSSLCSVDFGVNPRAVIPLQPTFVDVPTTCVIVVPDSNYVSWTNSWSSLVARGFRFIKHSEWEVAREYELSKIREDITTLQLAKWYPDGSVTSESQFTQGINYTLDGTNHTAMVKPFSVNGNPGVGDNSHLVGSVVIPPYVVENGVTYDVVGIASATYDFARPVYLTSVTAPTSVFDVGKMSFPASLVSVSLPAVTNVGEQAFSYGTSLASVSLPAAETIGKDAFRACTSLASVSLPAATSIGEQAFEGCTSLVSVSLPSAAAIGKNAFRECTPLASVSLPSATRISKGAFGGCTSLASVSLPELSDVGDNAFGFCTSLVSVLLPVAIDIGDDAFSDCTSLASVSLPAATSIGERAFFYCTSLSVCDFGGEERREIPALLGDAFEYVPTNCIIVVPDGNYNAWITTDGWSNLAAQGYRFLRHSEWEYARRYELPTKTSDLQNDSGFATYNDVGALVSGALADIHVMSESNGLVRGVAIGLRAEASGTSSDGNMQSVAIGPDSLASGGASLAVGSQIRAIGERSIAIGYGNDVGVSPSPRDSFGAMGTASIAIGDCASASNEYSTAVGFKSAAQEKYSTAVGNKAKVTGQYGVAVGSGSESIGTGSIAVGGIAGSASASRSIAVGSSSTSTNSQSVAIGSYAVAGGQRSVAIGGAANANSNPTKATAIRSTAIGAKAVATASDAVQIGEGENAASGTLQFRGFRVIEENGEIPEARIPNTIARTSQIPYTDDIISALTNSAAFMAAITNSIVFKSAVSNAVADSVAAELEAADLANPRSVAMFSLPINSEGEETRYTGIELKCSTNNFADVTYFANAFTDEYDGISMFVQNAGDDKRAYTRVSGTGTEIAATISNATELVILVSAADCEQNDGGWLNANNDDAAWTFARLSSAGREQNPDGSAMWRTCAPIRWFRRMPEWAIQSE